MTPSLLPSGPNAQHMLNPSSMSVVIVMVQRKDVLQDDPRTTARTVLFDEM